MDDVMYSDNGANGPES